MTTLEEKFYAIIEKQDESNVIHATICAERCGQHAKEFAKNFAEWITDNSYAKINYEKIKNGWCDESEYEWMGEENRIITTDQLLSLYEEHLLKTKP